MKKIIIVLILSVSTLLAYNYEPSSEMNEIPFEMTSGLPLIEVTLNGKKAKMLIDSGAMSSVLNIYSHMEYEFTFTEVDNENFLGAGGNLIRSGLVDNTCVMVDGRILPVRFKGLEMGIMSERLGIVGIIGSDYLDDYDYILDYEKNVIRTR